jgi:hypothetical protein
MSVTFDEVAAKTSRETLWNAFLGSLTPWQLHRLTKDETEMIAHDEFVLGLVTLQDVRAMIAYPPNEGEPGE